MPGPHDTFKPSYQRRLGTDLVFETGAALEPLGQHTYIPSRSPFRVFSASTQPRTSGLQHPSISAVTEIRVADRKFPITETTLSEAPGLRRVLDAAPRDAQSRPVLNADPGLFCKLLTFVHDKRWPADSRGLSHNELKILRQYSQRFGLPLLKTNVEKMLHGGDKGAHLAYGLALRDAAARSHNAAERDELNQRANKRLCRAQDKPAELPLASPQAAAPTNFSFTETRGIPLASCSSGTLFAVQTPRQTGVMSQVLQVAAPNAQPVTPASFGLRCRTIDSQKMLLSGKALLDATKAESESKRSLEGALPYWKQALQSMDAVPLDARAPSYALAQKTVQRVADAYLGSAQAQATDAENALRLNNTLLASAKLRTAHQAFAAVPAAWTNKFEHDRTSTRLTHADNALLLKIRDQQPHSMAPTQSAPPEQLPSTDRPLLPQDAAAFINAGDVSLPTTPEWDNLVALIPDVASQSVAPGHCLLPSTS